MRILSDSQRPTYPPDVEQGTVDSYWDLLWRLIGWYFRVVFFAVYSLNRSSWQSIMSDDLGLFLAHGRLDPERTYKPWTEPTEMIHACELVISDIKQQRPIMASLPVDVKRMMEDLTPFLATNHRNYRLDASLVLAATSDGHWCWVPEATKVGDVVCLFAGAPFPFIVRPVGDEDVLIGDAYVYGIMHGEAWPEDRNEVRSISLR